MTFYFSFLAADLLRSEEKKEGRRVKREIKKRRGLSTAS